jgi:Uma2 family endonuclease
MPRPLYNVTNPLTCDDLWRIREATDERLEIIDGELFATSPATSIHQVILRRLAVRFDRAMGDPRLGEIFPAMLDVRLAHDTVVQPDLIIVLSDRFNLTTDWGIDGPPSLVAEIVSTFSRVRDGAWKRILYARYEIPEYWLVDPEAETVTIFSDPQDGRYRAEQTTSDAAISATIPQLSADLKALFAPVPGL